AFVRLRAGLRLVVGLGVVFESVAPVVSGEPGAFESAVVGAGVGFSAGALAPPRSAGALNGSVAPPD
ncbi:MAG TPA: hypothetical protein VGV38_10115, partial [Pyrinomonadaceae bacterium]|nr:hypothetical protein [Pyrinomonadaceae bacterium]